MRLIDITRAPGGLILNGWQYITRVSGNSGISWGSQLQFKPSDKILLNYSSFVGTDKPDSARQSRLFHNIYGIFNITEKLGLTLGFDLGREKKTQGSDEKFGWWSPVAIAKYSYCIDTNDSGFEKDNY